MLLPLSQPGSKQSKGTGDKTLHTLMTSFIQLASIPNGHLHMNSTQARCSTNEVCTLMINLSLNNATSWGLSLQHMGL